MVPRSLSINSLHRVRENGSECRDLSSSCHMVMRDRDRNTLRQDLSDSYKCVPKIICKSQIVQHLPITSIYCGASLNEILENLLSFLHQRHFLEVNMPSQKSMNSPQKHPSTECCGMIMKVIATIKIINCSLQIK